MVMAGAGRARLEPWSIRKKRTAAVRRRPSFQGAAYAAEAARQRRVSGAAAQSHETAPTASPGGSVETAAVRCDVCVAIIR